MTETLTWRARLRFRVQKKIRIDGNEHRLQIAGREVVLTAPTPDLKIMDSEWLIMNARGFASEDAARQFGHRLKSAVEVSAVAARVGVDTGQNLATSGLGKMVKDALAQEGAHVRDNIHGLDVFADHPNTRIFTMSATGIVHAAPDPFLSDLDEFVRAAVTPSQRVADVIDDVQGSDEPTIVLQRSRRAAYIVNPDRYERDQQELTLLRRQLFLSEVREAEAEYQAAGTAHFDEVEALLDELRR